MQQISWGHQAPGRTRQASSRCLAGRCLAAGVVAAALVASLSNAGAQGLDCARLQQQIAQSDRGGGGRYAQAARRQAGELARTQAYAHQLGCDGFSFFGGNPQCGGINARISQMQANLSQLQGAGGGGRGELVARYNAYCRQAAPPQPRGFFESIFGGGQPQQPPPPPPPPADAAPDSHFDGDGLHARGGSQAVCVRTCDGGFFPLGISARHGAADLTEMCQALCPGTETAVYTRNPDSEIKTAVGLDGKPYMDLQNALHFQKSVTPSCSCRPAGKSWAETLANAEQVLDNTRKGDIMVTPEKSAELSRPKGDPAIRSTLSDPAPTSSVPPKAATATANSGATRAVRQVGPQP